MVKILNVVGARPNFMKMAPIVAELERRPQSFRSVLVHTGQHYDDHMSRVFLEELEMSPPDVNLSVGSGSHAQQTATIMSRFEPVLLDHRPDWVIVVGDVNSTLACALVCAKLGVPVAHVEAGLRSGDRTMPEEVNRVLTDRLADLLFTTSREAGANLSREGIDACRIHFVGNAMIDSLQRALPTAVRRRTSERLGLRDAPYILATLHRPANVDDPKILSNVLIALARVSRRASVVFPVHPRTRRRLESISFCPPASLHVVEPLGYLDFVSLMHSASLVITDSGGVQDETSYLGIPCLTVRRNTERPLTLNVGTNQLVHTDSDSIVAAVETAMRIPRRGGCKFELWDGKAAVRIVEVLSNARPHAPELTVKTLGDGHNLIPH